MSFDQAPTRREFDQLRSALERHKSNIPRHNYSVGNSETGTLFSLISTTTVNTTPSEVTILGTKSPAAGDTLPVDFLTVGKTIRGVVTGTTSLTSGGLVLRVKLGSGTIATATIPPGAGAGAIRIPFELTCRADGATGDVYGSLAAIFGTAGGVGENYAGVGSDLSVDTTGTLVLDVTIQPSISDAGNGIVTDVGVVTWNDPTP